MDLGWFKRLDRDTYVRVDSRGPVVGRRVGIFSITSRGHLRMRLPGGFYVRIF